MNLLIANSRIFSRVGWMDEITLLVGNAVRSLRASDEDERHMRRVA